MDKNQDLSSVGASGQGIVVERRDVIKGIALIAGGAFATTVSSAPSRCARSGRKGK